MKPELLAPDRRNSGSYKWDTMSGSEVIPLWVADMDFRACEPVMEALRRRVEHGVFGYTSVRHEYYKALIRWFSEKHGWEFSAQDVIYTSGVVPAVSAIIKALVPQGAAVALQTPAYNCFFSSIRNNGCRFAENPLKYSNNPDGSQRYSIDFEGLETILSKGDTPLMILCNPHNPTGRIWSVEELTRLAEICAANSVTVLSDEIHCELTAPGTSYNPFAPIAEKAGCRYVVCCSPSKAFNTAGLQIANIIAPSEGQRALIDRAININEVCDVNPFGVEALIAAYNGGTPWLESVRELVWSNYATMREAILEAFPTVVIAPLEATYLAWIDISSLGTDGDTVERVCEEKFGVRIASGSHYGSPDHIRINLACPAERLAEGLRRLIAGMKHLQK